MWFGFPFAAMLLLMLGVGLLKGYRRLGEFLRYLELKQRMHIGLISVLYAPFVMLGLVSFVMVALRF